MCVSGGLGGSTKTACGWIPTSPCLALRPFSEEKTAPSSNDLSHPLSPFLSRVPCASAPRSLVQLSPSPFDRIALRFEAPQHRVSTSRRMEHSIHPRGTGHRVEDQQERDERVISGHEGDQRTGGTGGCPKLVKLQVWTHPIPSPYACSRDIGHVDPWYILCFVQTGSLQPQLSNYPQLFHSVYLRKESYHVFLLYRLSYGANVCLPSIPSPSHPPPHPPPVACGEPQNPRGTSHGTTRGTAHPQGFQQRLGGWLLTQALDLQRLSPCTLFDPSFPPRMKSIEVKSVVKSTVKQNAQ